MYFAMGATCGSFFGRPVPWLTSKWYPHAGRRPDLRKRVAEPCVAELCLTKNAQQRGTSESQGVWSAHKAITKITKPKNYLKNRAFFR